MKTTFTKTFWNTIKVGVAFFVLSFFVNNTYGQQLEFVQALIVDDNQVSVPAGHVWQVTSMYGKEFRENECFEYYASPNSHEIGNTIKCAYQSSSYNWVRASYFISTFKVNGINVTSTISGFGSISRYNGASCTGTSNNIADASCVNQTSDPNILPIWLPAGTSLESGGPNTFLSVIEYKVY